MIQYKCDLCGEVIDKKDIKIFGDFPRRVATQVISVFGENVTAFEDLGIEETHLCFDCCGKIAAMLPIIKLD